MRLILSMLLVPAFSSLSYGQSFDFNKYVRSPLDNHLKRDTESRQPRLQFVKQSLRCWESLHVRPPDESVQSIRKCLQQRFMAKPLCNESNTAE